MPHSKRHKRVTLTYRQESSQVQHAHATHRASGRQALAPKKQSGLHERPAQRRQVLHCMADTRPAGHLLFVEKTHLKKRGSYGAWAASKQVVASRPHNKSSQQPESLIDVARTCVRQHTQAPYTATLQLQGKHSASYQTAVTTGPPAVKEISSLSSHKLYAR